MLVFSSIGAVRRNLVIQAIGLPLTIVTTIGGGFFDLRTVALLGVLGMALITAIALAKLNREVGTSWSDLVATITPSAIATLVTVAVPTTVMLVWGFPGGDNWPATIVAGASSVVSWLFALYLINHPLWRELLEAIQDLRQKTAAVFSG
jgi:hypothetical protein